MGFVIREGIGWLLVAAGLFGYFLAFSVFLLNDRVIEAGITGGMSTVLFRGGIHLVKVSTAARVVLMARKQRLATTPGP